MAKIEDHKYTIEEAFRECFYIVPDYQREYVWTEKEVQQLLQDIDEEFDVGDRREYFIGTVLVSPTQQKSHFEVIDGQQCLTTFFLLLCAMRQRFQRLRRSRQFVWAARPSLSGSTYATPTIRPNGAGLGGYVCTVGS